MNRKLFPLVACGFISAGGISQAADFYWGGTTNAFWQSSSSWFLSPSGTAAVSAPGLSDNAIFSITAFSGSALTFFLNGNTQANSLVFDNSGVVNISGTGGNRDLDIGAGGITLSATAANVTIGSTTPNRNVFVKIRADQTWTNNSSATLNIRNSSQASNSAAGPVVLTLNAAGSGGISNSGAFSDGTAGSLGLIVDSTGSGVVSIGSSNYTGGTTIKRGVLQSSGTFGTGTVLLGDTSGSSTARMHLSSAVVNSNNVTVQAGSTGLLQVTGIGGSDFAGNFLLNNTVILGSPTAGATVTYSGVMSGTGGVTMARIGAANNAIVVMNGNNTYTGKTTIESSVVVASSLNSVSGGSASSSLGAPTTIANGTITMSGSAASTLRYVGTGETTDRVIEIASSAGATLDQSGSGLLRFTSNLSNIGAGSRTLTLTGTTAGIGEFAGAINNYATGSNVGVTKTGIGTWRISGTANTYASATSISAGILEVTKLADTGQSSSLGTGSLAGLTIGGGTLRYLGNGDSSNRALTIGSAGATLDASGSGAINFSRTSAPAYGSSNVAVSLTLTGTSTGNNIYAANQNNNGTGLVTLTKNGTGTWVLTGTSTYTGGTTVNAGTLLLNGSSAAAVTVNGGVFGGTGTITNAVSISDSGTLAPGNSPGTINTGTLSLTGGNSTIAMEISGTGVGQYDRINVTGAVNLDGNGKIEVTMLSFVPQPTDIYFLILNDGVDAISGTLNGIAQGGTFSSGGYTWQVSYEGNSATNSFTGGNDLALQMVPEPSTLALLVGVGAVAVLRRRRR
jgi:fibronectin-binding autotransporter adhesin